MSCHAVEEPRHLHYHSVAALRCDFRTPQLEAISGDELLARLRSGESLVVVDVRPTEEYQAAHVAGAVSIPLAELEQRLRELPREREVVAYCRGPYCAFAPEA